MAEIVQGIGMSHSPMMAMEGEHWPLFQGNDLHHKLLYDETGQHMSYADLENQREGRYAEQASPENLQLLYEAMNRNFARLKNDFLKEIPDVAVIISNDHPGEFLDESNVPAIAVYCGDRLISADERKRMEKIKRKPLLDPDSEAFKKASKVKGMDKNNVWPGSGQVAGHIVESLIQQNFDVGVLREQKEPAVSGHGHGYGMVVTKLMDEDRVIPMVPVYLNIWPPNAISPSRCYDFGRALRVAIESIPDPLKVAVVASGGLSHFVTDVGIDQKVLNALRNRSEFDLRHLPLHRLKAGSGEIRNWIALAAAVEHLRLDWDEYIPVFRTAAGTGIGMTFCRWS